MKSPKWYEIIQILQICDKGKGCSRTKQLSMVVDKDNQTIQHKYEQVSTMYIFGEVFPRQT